EQEQQAGAALARDRVPLVRLEEEERAGAGVDALARGLDAHRAVDDDEERVLLHLVVAELLPGLEPDQDGARRLVVRMENDRRDAAARRLDLGEPPAAHRAILPGLVTLN